jgi:hypothetical protein
MARAPRKDTKAPTEDIEFGMHPHLLWDVINRQAGQLSKAVVEGVMNSVDAGAKACHVEVTQKKVVISDDGKGFASRQEIMDNFKEFGRPHVEGDARYGRFRMGRGQLFAFGTSEWKTHGFRISVDLKPQEEASKQAKGLFFSLRQDQEIFSGCQVDLQLYDKLSLTDLSAHLRAIREAVSYVDVPVFLNGEQINIDPLSQKWDFVTDDAFIKLGSGMMKVYNDGIFVCDMSPYHFGSGGVILSKKPLKINFARNSVQSDCSVYRRIKSVIEGKVETKIRTRPLNDHSRAKIIGDLVAGTKNLSEHMDARVVQDVTGSHHPLKALFVSSGRTGIVTIAPRGDRVGERVHTRKMAFVMSEDSASRFGARDPEGLVAILRKLAARDHVKAGIPAPKSIDHFRSFVSDTYTPVDDKDLLKAEKIAIRIIRAANETLVYNGNIYDDGHPGTFQSSDRGIASRAQSDALLRQGAIRWFQARLHGIRKVSVGESDTAMAWTDGLSGIWIDRKQLKEVTRGFAGFHLLSSLLLHEYLHEGPSTGTHEHGVEFYERFHDLSLRSDLMNQCVNAMMSEAVKILKAEPKGLPRELMKQLDSHERYEDLGIAPEAVVEPEIEAVPAPAAIPVVPVEVVAAPVLAPRKRRRTPDAAPGIEPGVIDGVVIESVVKEPPAQARFSF